MKKLPTPLTFVQTQPLMAKAPNERWAIDMCRIWTGRDGWITMALVINCHSRELLGNPYDSHTLAEALEPVGILIGTDRPPPTAVVDK